MLPLRTINTRVRDTRVEDLKILKNSRTIVLLLYLLLCTNFKITPLYYHNQGSPRSYDSFSK
jgi:hypothetical protein